MAFVGAHQKILAKSGMHEVINHCNSSCGMRNVYINKYFTNDN